MVWHEVLYSALSNWRPCHGPHPLATHMTPIAFVAPEGTATFTLLVDFLPSVLMKALLHEHASVCFHQQRLVPAFVQTPPGRHPFQ